MKKLITYTLILSICSCSAFNKIDVNNQKSINKLIKKEKTVEIETTSFSIYQVKINKLENGIIHTDEKSFKIDEIKEIKLYTPERDHAIKFAAGTAAAVAAVGVVLYIFSVSMDNLVDDMTGQSRKK